MPPTVAASWTSGLPNSASFLPRSRGSQYPLGVGSKKSKQQKLAFAKEPQPLFLQRDIAQADNLARVRSIVAAVDAGVTTPHGFFAATGISARHVAYNRRAALILELLAEGKGVTATTRGKALLATDPDSAAERECLLQTILSAKLLVPFRDVFEADTEISVADLGYRIGVMTALKKNTAERRAQTLLAWRRYVRESTAASKTITDHAELAAMIKKQIEAQNAKAMEDYLAALQTMKPAAFEKLIGKLIEAMGYESVKVTGGAGDGGVDVRAVQSIKWATGTPKSIAVQVKRYRKTVSRRYVHELIGVMHNEKCHEGLLVTTGMFQPKAQDEAAKMPNLWLVDGPQLVLKLIEHKIGMMKDDIGAIVPVDTKKATAKK
jgi:restriction endonuclease Mrr